MSASGYDSLGWRLLAASVTAGARCVVCGSADDLVAHHIVPRGFGGADVPSNLEPVCRACHPRREMIARAAVPRRIGPERNALLAAFIRAKARPRPAPQRSVSPLARMLTRPRP
jgi:HNH endonuclease